MRIDDANPDQIPGAEYAMLAVRDTGCGIPGDVIGRVFEPFFTTKDTGKGSGLGLSMVYGFVTQSGGHVRIASAPGPGTCVRIYLPRFERGADPMPDLPPIDQRTADDAAQPVPRTRPGETVLLVEDNDDVRRFAAAALAQLGYRVLEAPDARTALGMLDDLTLGRIDVLFTDVVLPGGMSGPELADAVDARRPGVATLYTSGYTGGPLTDRHELRRDGRLLAKPFHVEGLAQAIRRCIDGHRQAVPLADA